MSAIRPFRALRPRPGVAARLASVPYDVVNTEEARALADGNELSFLRVSRAEIELPGVDPYADAVYARAKENFECLVRDALVEDEAPAIYVYRLRMGAHEQTGVAACFSVEEYNGDAIKKHETTRKEKEDDRTRHIIELGAQTGPVLLTYRERANIDALVARARSREPIYDFIAPDGVSHTVWQAADDERDALVAAFAEVPELYIADGHHRAASAARAHAHLAARGEASGEHAWFLAVAFPDNQMRILAYHRVVKDLSGLTPDAFVAKLGEVGELRRDVRQPTRRGECGVYVGGAWHTLTLPRESRPSDPTAALDVSILSDAVLGPTLGIGDLRVDHRCDFVGGIRGVEELERLVDSGRAAAAFAMYPVSVADLLAIADAGAIMPPKSTWFEPKLRDGLLVHRI
jgi:uncharacterized protein (DUF1015 family)